MRCPDEKEREVQSTGTQKAVPTASEGAGEASGQNRWFTVTQAQLKASQSPGNEPEQGVLSTPP